MGELGSALCDHGCDHGGNAAGLAECPAAVHLHGMPVVGAPPVVLISSYRSTRLQPNLTAPLAMGLAQEGVPVLFHDVLREGAGTTCAQVLRDLALAPCPEPRAVHSPWARRAPAFVDAAPRCPLLHALFDVRDGAAVRHAARRLAALPAPIDGVPSLRLLAAGAGGDPAATAAWLMHSRCPCVALAQHRRRCRLAGGDRRASKSSSPLASRGARCRA